MYLCVQVFRSKGMLMHKYIRHSCYMIVTELMKSFMSNTFYTWQCISVNNHPLPPPPGKRTSGVVTNFLVTDPTFANNKSRM